MVINKLTYKRMKTIQAYEFQDLTPEIQERVKEREATQEIDFQLQDLANQLSDGILTEDEYYKAIGCDKHYAETTGWFVPSVFYKHNKDLVDTNVQKQVSHMLYNVNGVIIGNKDEDSAV